MNTEIKDYLNSLGFHDTELRKLSLAEAKKITSSNYSISNHLCQWEEAAKYDGYTDICTPLRLYVLKLDSDLFGRLILSQIGGEDIQKDLMPSEIRNGSLINSVCELMKQKNLNINSFLSGASHHTDWTNRVADYYNMLATSPNPPCLLTTIPLENERKYNPDASLFISDGNHRALAIGIYHFVEGNKFPDIEAIVAWGDRDTLLNKYKIKI